MSSLLTRLHAKVASARANAHVAKNRLHHEVHEASGKAKYVDLSIQFIGASGLPKMDLVGTADPFFVAKLDDNISYISTVQPGTQAPVWNESWHVKNVPSTAGLNVTVYDKDNGRLDDVIGTFHTTINPGAKECEIEGTITGRTKGTFWLKIESREPADNIQHCPPYTFDGPIRYSRHFSPTVGRLTAVNDERLYSTWKVSLKAVPAFFDHTFQEWNHDYSAAKTIFGTGPSSFAVRSSIKTGHSLLYARSTRNGFGTIQTAKDVTDLLCGGGRSSGPRELAKHRVKPAVYTYVIAPEDETFRFSETGAAFFVDFASKHALHANCSEKVYYSGEFHPRPKGGWASFSDDTPDDQVEWELVIDNNSGTYSPDKEMLPALQACLSYNFPWFTVLALDHEDPALKESREACRDYALTKRGVTQEELQPHANEGEETLMSAIGHGAHALDSDAMGEGVATGSS
ncbi:unnamed protein product [Peniophora sp. CBMAI 1063]|nr:unnamed protein product [Peniophora sp. CBMAI 1063]